MSEHRKEGEFVRKPVMEVAEADDTLQDMKWNDAMPSMKVDAESYKARTLFFPNIQTQRHQLTKFAGYR